MCDNNNYSKWMSWLESKQRAKQNSTEILISSSFGFVYQYELGVVSLTSSQPNFVKAEMLYKSN